MILRKFAINIFCVFTIVCAILSCGGKNITDDRMSASLLLRPDIEIKIDKKLLTPILIRGNISSLDKLVPNEPSESAMLFIESYKKDFKLNDPRNELIISKISKDKIGFEFISFLRIDKGIPIWGDELRVHFNNKDVLYYINGRYHPSLPEGFNHRPSITVAQAEQIAIEYYQEKGTDFNSENPELVILPKTSIYFLAYKITLMGSFLNPFNMEIFIDANNGEILESINNLQE